MKYNRITIWAACTVLAFGLGGCAADNLVEKRADDGKEKPVGDVVSFIAIDQSDEDTSDKTRLGAEELSDRIRFRWTVSDWQNLYCDVTPLAANATWQKAEYQYPIEIDPDKKKFYKSIAFVFPDLKPLRTTDGDGDTYADYQNPTNRPYWPKEKAATDSRITTVYSSARTSDGTYYSGPLYSELREQSSFYPVLFTGSGKPNEVNVRGLQRQGGMYPDSLGFNGACFVGIAFANSRSQMYGKQGFQEFHNKDKNRWEYTWTRYTLYFGNSNNQSGLWRTALPSYLDASGNTGIATNYGSSYYLWPRSHNTDMVMGHKTSYVSVMPYNPKGEMNNVFLKTVKIEVKNQAINGRHKLSVAGIDLSDRGSHTFNSYKSITLNIDDGLTVAQTRERARDKVAVITALPGEYTDVVLSLSFKDSGTGLTFSPQPKDYKKLKMRLEEGKNLPIYVKLDIPSFNRLANGYHMWGSMATYWPQGHVLENWNFTTEATGSIPAPASPGDTWPKSSSDERWYNDQDIQPASTSLDDNAPTSNDVSYVLDKCYWDDQTMYLYDGHLFKGLLWIPIIEKNKSVAADGTDWISTPPTTSSWNYLGTGGPHNVSGYFALAPLGYYEDGALKDVGKEGRYWLYDGAASDTDHAYSIQFNKDGIKIVYDTPRKHGYMAMPTRSVND